MENKTKKSSWVPEVTYEESDEGQLGNLPLVHVPPDEKMPQFLLIWEARDTGELEPGPQGEEVPVVQWALRQYAQMDVLKANLTAEEYDRVRIALGLKPLAEAMKQGQAITDRVRANVTKTQGH